MCTLVVREQDSERGRGGERERGGGVRETGEGRRSRQGERKMTRPVSIQLCILFCERERETGRRSVRGPPLYFLSARGAQSPRTRLPAASVRGRGFRRYGLGRPWVLIRPLLVPGARLSGGAADGLVDEGVWRGWVFRESKSVSKQLASMQKDICIYMYIYIYNQMYIYVCIRIYRHT